MQYGQGVVLPGFGPGTMIDTEEGDLPVEWLDTSDRVKNRDNGLGRVLWIGRTTFQPDYFREHPEACPVRFEAGALGDGRPSHPVMVGPDQPVLINSTKAARHFGTTEVLAPARAFVNDESVCFVDPEDPITFTFVFCAQHQVMGSDNSWLGSYLPEAETLIHLTPDHREMLADLPDSALDIPESRMILTSGEARLILPGYERRRILRKHG